MESDELVGSSDTAGASWPPIRRTKSTAVGCPESFEALRIHTWLSVACGRKERELAMHQNACQAAQCNGLEPEENKFESRSAAGRREVGYSLHSIQTAECDLRMLNDPITTVRAVAVVYCLSFKLKISEPSI